MSKKNKVVAFIAFIRQSDQDGSAAMQEDFLRKLGGLLPDPRGDKNKPSLPEHFVTQWNQWEGQYRRQDWGGPEYVEKDIREELCQGLAKYGRLKYEKPVTTAEILAEVEALLK